MKGVFINPGHAASFLEAASPGGAVIKKGYGVKTAVVRVQINAHTNVKALRTRGLKWVGRVRPEGVIVLWRPRDGPVIASQQPWIGSSPRWLSPCDLGKLSVDCRRKKDGPGFDGLCRVADVGLDRPISRPITSTASAMGVRMVFTERSGRTFGTSVVDGSQYACSGHRGRRLLVMAIS